MRGHQQEARCQLKIECNPQTLPWSSRLMDEHSLVTTHQTLCLQWLKLSMAGGMQKLLRVIKPSRHTTHWNLLWTHYWMTQHQSQVLDQGQGTSKLSKRCRSYGFLHKLHQRSTKSDSSHLNPERIQLNQATQRLRQYKNNSVKHQSWSSMQAMSSQEKRGYLQGRRSINQTTRRMQSLKKVAEFLQQWHESEITNSKMPSRKLKKLQLSIVYFRRRAASLICFLVTSEMK